MTIAKIDNNKYKATRLVCIAFVTFTFISYLYVVITGTYNGDYINKTTQLSQWELLVSFVYTVLPFLILFGIYKFFKKKNNPYKITVPYRAFGQLLLFLLIFQIITTYLYGVGELTKSIYKAPVVITIFIQIFNRFNALWGTLFYILVVKKENKLQYLLLVLCVILSFLRTSLMIFAVISFFFLILNYKKIVEIVKKNFIWVIIGAFVFPTMVAVLYDFRDSMRFESKIEFSDKMSSSKLLFGKLVGRLSSYPSTTIIMERKDKVSQLVKENNMSSFLYSKEAVAVFYGKILDNERLLYKNIMLESEDIHVKTFSMMPGTQGNLMVASYNSFFTFIVTLGTILGIVVLTFFFASFFHYEGVLEMIFLFFCISVMSGVAGEYMEQLMYLLLYLSFFLIMNFLSKKKRINT